MGGSCSSSGAGGGSVLRSGVSSLLPLSDDIPESFSINSISGSESSNSSNFAGSRIAISSIN